MIFVIADESEQLALPGHRYVYISQDFHCAQQQLDWLAESDPILAGVPHRPRRRYSRRGRITLMNQDAIAEAAKIAGISGEPKLVSPAK